MLLQRNLLLLLCHGKPTEAHNARIYDFMKYGSNLYVSGYCFVSIVVNASACDIYLPDRLRNEANHTAHDLPGVEAFVAFEHPLKISKMELYKHVNT